MNTRVRSDSRALSLGPGRIALAYAVLAILWIAFSDAAVAHLKLPPAVMTIKGTVFVLVTAALLYFTIRRLVQFVQHTSQERITERKEVEKALRRLSRKLRAIGTCNQVLLRATDEQSLLNKSVGCMQEAGDSAVWVGYAEHDEAKSVRRVAFAGIEEESLTMLRISWADTEPGRGIVGRAIRTAKTACIDDTQQTLQRGPGARLP